MDKNIKSFLGFNSEYENAEIVSFGCPFDGTTSFRPGTRFAPDVIRMESYGLETYSPYLDRDLVEITAYDAGDLQFPFGNTEKVLGIIEDFTDRVVEDGKKVLMVGGEHLVSLPVIKSVHKKYKDLHVIHFDAHTDLRDFFKGEPLSHATVLKKVWDFLGDGKLFQYGIRSGDREEFYWAKEHTFLNKYDFTGLNYAVEKIGDKPVYLTIDLDVLDPSAFPGTGTPEPGGVTFKELMDALNTIKNLNIVGADIVELAPHYDHSGISNAVACKVLREVALIMGCKAF